MPDAYKILLVEDQEDDVYLFKLRLKNAKQFTLAWHVVDGAEALDYLQGTGAYRDREKYPFPDLMVLDLNLPKMNGFEVLQGIQGKFANLKVGIFTTSEDSRDMERALGLGAHLFQTKTFERMALCDFYIGCKSWPQPREESSKSCKMRKTQRLNPPRCARPTKD